MNAQTLKRLLPGLVLAAAFCALELLAFAGAARLKTLYAAPISLRYETPITPQQIEALVEYSAGAGESAALNAVFWRQQAADLKGPAGSSPVTALCFWGEAANVWPGPYTQGSAPGGQDAAGCAVSEELAWRLWGSLDPVGLTLEWAGQTRTVRGVFQGEQALLLAPTKPDETGFTGVELTKPGGALYAEAARGFAQSSGLGLPAAMVYGQGLASLAALAGWLPVVWLGGAVLLALWRSARSWPALARRCLWFTLALAAALALPSLLAALPPWLLPTRWSDFSFWSGLARQLAGQAAEWFALTPTVREVAAKALLARQALVGAALALCAQRLTLAIRYKTTSSD